MWVNPPGRWSCWCRNNCVAATVLERDHPCAAIDTVPVTVPVPVPVPVTNVVPSDVLFASHGGASRPHALVLCIWRRWAGGCVILGRAVYYRVVVGGGVNGDSSARRIPTRRWRAQWRRGASV